MTNPFEKNWWSFLEADQKSSLLQSYTLLSEEKHQRPDRFTDYSYIVFPAAKSYEGILKKIFLTLGLITRENYYSDRFRIGKSLNPALRHDPSADNLFDRLASLCQNSSLPQRLWDTWKQSRNLLFHYFPHQENFISLFQAEKRLNLIISALDLVFSTCQLDQNQRS